MSTDERTAAIFNTLPLLPQARRNLEQYRSHLAEIGKVLAKHEARLLSGGLRGSTGGA